MTQSWSDRLSLRSKATLLVALVTILTLITVAGISVLQMRRLVSDQEHETVDAVAGGFGHAAELSLAVRDERELSRLAERFMRNDQILLIAIYDEAGKLIAKRARTPELWQNYVQGNPDRNLLLCEKTVTLGGAENEFSAPDFPAEPPTTSGIALPPRKSNVGRVVVGLSAEPALIAQQKQIQLTLMITLLAVAGSTVTVYALVGTWTRRLNHLVVASERISHGDFEAAIHEQRRDEIGRLSGAYENMRRAVQQRDLELRQFNNTLQAQVQERTRSLEEALQAAQAADKAKSRFLATMSHEIRTPLNGVVGTVDLLRQTTLDENQRRYVQVAKSSADALLTVINDILDFSKIEAGRMELDTVPFDLQETVEDVARMTAMAAARKGLELSCYVEQDLPSQVVGDPGRLRQILTNLLNNATKFTDRGQVVIRVARDTQTEGGVLIRFSVSDTGIGIPPERLGRLFHSFSQVDASTTRKYGGSGLGLAISKRLVELMGGAIGVESELGRGSTFWFTLLMPVSTAASAKPRQIWRDMRQARVIAIDDNPVNCEILEKQLEAWKMDGVVVQNGPQALQLMREAARTGTPFDVAILDWHMPGMDGVEVARAIRGSDELRGVSLIMLTSIEDQVQTAELRDMGFSGYLIKPVCQSQLFDAVATAFKNTGPAPKLAVPASPAAPPPAAARGIHVLLAEDNEINQMVAAAILTKSGFTCDIVDNGVRAVESALTGQYDLVLMDCQMPQMDGFDASREIRRREAETHVPLDARLPIVALTANAIKGDRDLCLQAGMDDYVSKPIDHTKLCEAIRSSLARSRWRRTTASAPGATSAAAQASASPGAGGPAPLAAHASVASGTSGILASFLQSPPDPAAPLVPEPAPSSPDAPPLNLTELYGRCMNNVEFARKILAKFQDRVGDDLASLTRTIAERKFEEAARLAHALKGSAANLSAAAVRGAAAEIETLSRLGDAAQTEQALDRLRLAIDQCLAYIPEAIAGPTPTLPEKMRP